MWSAIDTNKRKSVLLIVLLAVVLMGLGWAVGYLLFPDDGGLIGVMVAIIIWVIMMLVSFSGSEKILLASAGAREVKHKDAPQLYNIVEEMCIASGIPKVPRVYIIDNAAPNAFAVGLTPERGAVAVTTGLLACLNRDELQGVIAHELGHINNRDTMFMTLAGVTVGAVILLADLFMRGMWFSSGRRRGSSRSEGNFAIVMLIITIIVAILAPILAQILYFACSRRREYLADASAALYTRYPEGLASALKKISGTKVQPMATSRALAPMFIVNPLAAKGKGAGLFSTHPAIKDRVNVLLAMGSNVSLAGYNDAYSSLHKSSVFEASALDGEAVSRRKSGTSKKNKVSEQWRNARDLLHKVDGFTMLACTCGLRIKVPPEYNQAAVTCPRCRRKNKIKT